MPLNGINEERKPLDEVENVYELSEKTYTSEEHVHGSDTSAAAIVSHPEFCPIAALIELYE